ncbi:MAG: PAS domain S-box protein [Desulfobacterales bacterium]|nr:PAS domain S-box protein [Desulfobacterales bacterium]
MHLPRAGCDCQGVARRRHPEAAVPAMLLKRHAVWSQPHRFRSLDFRFIAAPPQPVPPTPSEPDIREEHHAQGTPRRRQAIEEAPADQPGPAAEMALKVSEERCSMILENIQDGYYEVDLDGNYTFFNEGLLRITGYSREEMLGMNNRRIVDDYNNKKVFKVFHQVYLTGVPAHAFDWECIRKDGTRRFVEVSVTLKRDATGPADRLHGHRPRHHRAQARGAGPPGKRRALPHHHRKHPGRVLRGRPRRQLHLFQRRAAAHHRLSPRRDARPEQPPDRRRLQQQKGLQRVPPGLPHRRAGPRLRLGVHPQGRHAALRGGLGDPQAGHLRQARRVHGDRPRHHRTQAISGRARSQGKRAEAEEQEPRGGQHGPERSDEESGRAPHRQRRDPQKQPQQSRHALSAEGQGENQRQGRRRTPAPAGRKLELPFLRRSPTIWRPNFPRLTSTEIDVANFIVQGKRTKEIADVLSVTPKAIEVHRNNLRRKFGLTNQKTGLRTHLLSLR